MYFAKSVWAQNDAGEKLIWNLFEKRETIFVSF